MDASFFIAGRLRFKGNIAVISIAVSFLVMIIAVAVSSGFRHEVRNGLSSMSGDVRLMPPTMSYLDENEPIESDPAYLPYVQEVQGVRSIEPAVYRAGIVKNGENIHGVMFKGVPGGVFEASDSVALAVSIPSRLAEISGLKTGDRMLAYFVGDKVKARQFNVVSVHQTMVQTDDRLIVYADLQDMNIEILDSAGISREMIDISTDCTAHMPHVYHSHRATGGNRGVGGGIIGIIK